MLTSIKIENFKCFENENLKLKPLTLITGTNSSGKSSLLQAILMLTEHKNLEISHYLLGLGLFDELKNKYINPSLFTITGSFNNCESIELKVTKVSSSIQHSVNNKFIYPNNISYLNANRQIFSSQQVFLPSTKEERRFGITGENIAGYFNEYKDELIAGELVTKQAASYTLEGQADYWLNKISGYSYQLQTEAIDTSSVRVFYKNEKGLTFRPNNIGTGISFLASIIVACLTAQKDSVLLIENPEIHLHPQSQSKLAEFFAFIASKGVQLIIETHNDHLINRVRYEVFKEKISHDAVVIYYKEAERSFRRININSAGRFEDEKGENTFPTGFYDATLKEIFDINQGKQ